MKRNKKKQFLKILSIGLIFSLLLFIPLFAQRLIKITKIECLTQFGTCEDRISNKLQIRGNYKDSKRQIEVLLKQDVQVNDYLIQFKFPSTLKIELNIKKPKYAIKNSLDNKYYLISADGMILDERKEGSLPTLIVSEKKLRTGEIIDEEYKFAFKILDNLDYLYSIKEGEIKENYLKIKNNESISVFIPTYGDIEYIVGSIRLIFSRLNKGDEGIRMNEISEIDLRFKNPILRKK